MKKIYLVAVLFLSSLYNGVKTAQGPLLTIAPDQFAKVGSTIIVFRDQMPLYEKVADDFKWRVAPNKEKYSSIQRKNAYCKLDCPYNQHLFVFQRLSSFSAIMEQSFVKGVNTRGKEYTLYLKASFLPVFIKEARKFAKLINEPWHFHIVLMEANLPEACMLVSSAIRENQRNELNILHAIQNISVGDGKVIPHDVAKIIETFL